jgi:hypothetical protein
VLSMVDKVVIDAQKAFEQQSHLVMKEFHLKTKSRIAMALQKIGDDERKRTNDRLANRGTFAKMVSKKRVVKSKYERSAAKHQLGTLSFGAFEPVQGEGRWKTSTMTGEIIDLASIIHTGMKEATITRDSLHTEKQQKRGYIFGGNYWDTKKNFNMKLKIGKVKGSGVDKVDDFLPKAEENILRDLEIAVKEAVNKAIREAGRKVK